MKRKFVLSIILAAMVVSGGAIGYYYWYQGEHYVSTEDARIAGDIYRIMPRMSAKLTALTIHDGDVVAAEQVVGQQDTGNVQLHQLENALLRAPISGTVLKTMAKVGEVVSPGQTIAMVVDESKLYVSANIEETEIQRIHAGQPVEITVDAYPDVTLPGEVVEIGQATNATFSLLPATNTSGNFTKVVQRIPVKIAIHDQAGLDLATGMNATIKIQVKGTEGE